MMLTFGDGFGVKDRDEKNEDVLKLKFIFFGWIILHLWHFYCLGKVGILSIRNKKQQEGKPTLKAISK